jgi:uncharacterized protein (DUF433 family)
MRLPGSFTKNGRAIPITGIGRFSCAPSGTPHRLDCAASAKQINGVHERISTDPNVCHGQACVRGTRIPVHQIFRMLANGDSIETLLNAYPSLTGEDVLACFDYAGTLAEDEITPLEPMHNT